MKRVCTNHTVQDKNALLFLNYKINSCKLRALSIFFLLACLFTGKAAFAQQNNLLDKKITLELQDARIPTILDALGNQVGCTFSYSSTLIDINKKVTVNYQDITVREALSQLIGHSLKKLHVHDNIVDIQIHGAKGKIKGKITDPKGQPVPFASIGLKGTAHANMADENGNYEIHAHEGDYILLAQLTGYDSYEVPVRVTSGKTTNHTISMQTESSKELDEVMIIGKSEAQEIKESGFTVNVIDAKLYANMSTDLNQVLNRSSGVRIRESGGVGSSFNFSLNGFTGRQVKFFIDGVPMDNFGSSFQLNNIPINMAERIEVYKGAVPVSLGSDALGGAINIITNNKMRTYLDASYSYGSFNTHRTSINAGHTFKSGFTTQFNFIQNYSDNNYWVDVDVNKITINTEGKKVSSGVLEPARVKRFHDKYRNEAVIVNVGVTGKKYADKLLIGITLGQNKADIQTGARMISVFGDWHRKGTTIMPSIRYQKSDLFVKGLSLSLTGNYNFGEEQNIDTVNRRYNWIREYVDPSVNEGKYIAGGERSRSLYKYKNNNGLITTNLTYQLNPKHSISLNNVFNTFNRKGSDELTPNSEALEQPKRTDKNIIGLSYKFTPSKRWNTSLFLKQYTQNNISSDAMAGDGGWGTTRYVRQQTTFNLTGYGFATGFFLTSKLELKASFEKSYRLPENDELFGDVVNLEGNNKLRPESSNNYNLGFIYSLPIKKSHKVIVEINGLYRSAKDFIRPSLNTNQSHQVMSNQRDVRNIGINGEIRYSYKRLFVAGINGTYQDLRNATQYEEGSTKVSTVYMDRIPNMPYLFGNADASIFFNQVGGKSNTLSFGYNLMYVNAYYLRWPSQGHDKKDIPTQITHDLNLVYSLKNGKYNISFECRNITDKNVYDNFTLQKPGRSFSVKIRYFFSK